MVVVNVVGYPFAVNYNGEVHEIPFDNKGYTVPDDLGNYKELKIVEPPKPVKRENILEVNDNVLYNAKENIKLKNKPLKGIKIKKKKRNNILTNKKIERKIKNKNG